MLLMAGIMTVSAISLIPNFSAAQVLAVVRGIPALSLTDPINLMDRRKHMDTGAHQGRAEAMGRRATGRKREAWAAKLPLSILLSGR